MLRPGTPGRGNVKALEGSPSMFPVCEAGRKTGQGLVTRGNPAPLLPLLPSSAPRSTYLPRPPPLHAQPDSERELRWGSPPGGRCGHRDFLQRESCESRLPPQPPPTAPITHSLSLSGQQGRRRGRGRYSAGMPAPGEVSREGGLLLHQRPPW